MMSRFPKLTETFVLDEILEMERQGVHVEVFPLWREHAKVVHPDAACLAARAHHFPVLSFSVLRDVLYWLRQRPDRFFGTLLVLLLANVRSLRFLAGALVAFPKSCAVARRLQSLDVQHLHAHFASHPAAAAYVIGRLTDVPWSFTAHGSDLHREQAMLVDKVKAAKFVVAISDYNRRFIGERVGSELTDRIRVVRCGVDARAFPISAPVESTFRIVCIGTLHEVKGQRFLLEACARAEMTDWHCHLIGDGPDRQSLARLAEELGIAERVTFHGSCTRERVRELLGTMTVACAPSVPTSDGRREGIPVALMEGAACGLPLIASRLSGIPELVVDDDSGILIEPGDVGGLARALTRLAAEPATRKRLGCGARSRVQRDFSLKQNVTTLRHLMLDEAQACSH